MKDTEQVSKVCCSSHWVTHSVQICTDLYRIFKSPVVDCSLVNLQLPNGVVHPIDRWWRNVENQTHQFWFQASSKLMFCFFLSCLYSRLHGSFSCACEPRSLFGLGMAGPIQFQLGQGLDIPFFMGPARFHWKKNMFFLGVFNIRRKGLCVINTWMNR